jgi:hypothetical protein
MEEGGRKGRREGGRDVPGRSTDVESGLHVEWLYLWGGGGREGRREKGRW